MNFAQLSQIDFLPELSSADIHRKAQILQDVLPRTLFDPCGLVISLPIIVGPQQARAVSETEAAHIVEGDWYSADEWISQCMKTEWMTFENSLTTAGLYLDAQAARFRASASPEAMAEAQRAFRSIELVYEMGAAAESPGWLPKPYGRRATRTSTPDQYLFALRGLFAFHAIAPPKQRNKIKRIFVHVAEFCRQRNYQVDFLPGTWTMIDQLWGYNAIYMMINTLALHVSGEKRFEDELKRLDALGRWRHETHLEAWAREGLKRVCEFERIVIGHFAILGGEIVHRLTPWVFGDTDAEVEKNWQATLHRWFEFGKLGINATYQSHYWVDIDVQQRTWRPTGLTTPDPQLTAKNQLLAYRADFYWSEGAYRHLYTSLLTATEARGTGWAAEAERYARQILERADGRRLHWMVDPDGRQLLPTLKHAACILSSEAPEFYLLAYWRGRLAGMW